MVLDTFQDQIYDMQISGRLFCPIIIRIPSYINCGHFFTTASSNTQIEILYLSLDITQTCRCSMLSQLTRFLNSYHAREVIH